MLEMFEGLLNKEAEEKEQPVATEKDFRESKVSNNPQVTTKSINIVDDAHTTSTDHTTSPGRPMGKVK